MRSSRWGRLGRALVMLGLFVAACGDEESGPTGGRDASGESTGGQNVEAGSDSAGASGAPGVGGNLANGGRTSSGGGRMNTAGVAGAPLDAGDSGPDDGSIESGTEGGEPPVLAPDVAKGVRFIGRVDLSDRGRPRFSWSGTGFIAAFTGTGLSVRMNNERAVVFKSVIDDSPRPARTVQAGESSYSIASNLPNERHVIAFYRQTEGQEGDSTLLEVDVADGNLEDPPEAPTRLIEIVGDSISCGYGNLGTIATCKYTIGTQSHWDTYGAIAARQLDASVSTIAISGRGMYRNGDGSDEELMPEVYDRTIANSELPKWSFDPQPDAVVINLGTNDFATGVPDNGFSDGYLAFIDAIREKYPDTYILCSIGPMLSDSFPEGQAQLTNQRDYVQGVVAIRNEAGDERVGFIEFTVQEEADFGCDYHPNAAKHQSMGDQLTEKLKTELGW